MEESPNIGFASVNRHGWQGEVFNIWIDQYTCFVQYCFLLVLLVRKLKKPETNGPIGGFTPHPPEKSAWNSPRPVTNGINHSPEEVDPFTGEIKKSRKKDPFTSTGDEAPSPDKDDDGDCEEKIDPFTGQVVRTKKKEDPFTSATSVDFESEPKKEEDVPDVKVDPFTGAPIRTKKDPFTAMNSIDFDNDKNGEEFPPSEIPSRTFTVKKDPFTAMNSIDFSGTNDEEEPPDPVQDRTPNQRDPFTAMNSIDCGSPTNDIKAGDESANVVESSISIESEHTFDPVADDETGEQNGLVEERRVTPDGSDGVEGVINLYEEPKVESSPSSEVYLSDSNDLLKSSSTDDFDEIESSRPPLVKSRRLSPLQEHSSQEQSTPERQNPLGDQSNTNNNESPKLVDEYGESVGESEENKVDDDKREGNNDAVTEIHTTEIEANKEEVLEIDEESDSDDLVVMPGLYKKPLANENNSASKTDLEVATEAKDDELLPVATSTPAKEGGESTSSDPPVVPPLDLGGIVDNDDDTSDDAKEDKVPSAAKSVDSGHEDDEDDDDSGSELEEMDTLKASTFVAAQNSGDSESEIIVRRKSRTKKIPDIVASPDEESGVESSSNIIKKGRLSPIVPTKQPPPLEENFSSLVLRTCHKKDNFASSVVMSEPMMRSTEELSDTNRSYLSTGALPQISTKKVRNR